MSKNTNQNEGNPFSPVSLPEFGIKVSWAMCRNPACPNFGLHYDGPGFASGKSVSDERYRIGLKSGKFKCQFCGLNFTLKSNQSIRPLGACAIGCFCWAPRGFAGNETSDCLLQSATRGPGPAGGRGMPVDGPADRADWGRIALLHAAASPCIRFMFNARHTRAHSPRAWFNPRTLKRRKPSACLIQPLGASDSHLRLAYCA